MAEHVMAIDQGTTSTRAIVFDRHGGIVATAQREHAQIFPQAGWVEHDPVEIWTNTEWVVSHALGKARLHAADLAGIGVTNQRETAIVWDRRTGRPVYNAVVWQDTRTQDRLDRLADHADRITGITGLPLATYFSASKLAWILDSVPGAREAAEAGDILFGTPDTWIVWNLTGGPSGGEHITDVTNASRTLLMDLTTLDWSDEMLGVWGIPRAMLPAIRSSSEVVGTAQLPAVVRGVPVAGILGDQQAAAFGQAAFDAGQSKNTYGTGNFLLVNTGTELVRSSHGLITTVAYRCGTDETCYALEGSIAVTGSLVQWLRDNLGIIRTSQEVQTLAESVDDNGGAYFVPAFSGLFAPYWRPDARGVLVGLTRYVTKAHIARAALESTAFQTRDVLGAVAADTGRELDELRVDGGMTHNDLLVQFQADILGIPVVRPTVVETTALGAAYAAGLATGLWDGFDDLRAHWREDRRFEPVMSVEEREQRYRTWQKAVSKSLDWVD